MAGNEKLHQGRYLSVACSDPATPATGDPVRIGKIGGVAMTTEDAAGNATIDIGPAVYSLSVFDEATGGVTLFQEIWYDDTGAGSPSTKLSNLTTGAEAFFGYALSTLGNGVTGLVDVLVTRRGL